MADRKTVDTYSMVKCESSWQALNGDTADHVQSLGLKKKGNRNLCHTTGGIISDISVLTSAWQRHVRKALLFALIITEHILQVASSELASYRPLRYNKVSIIIRSIDNKARERKKKNNAHQTPKE